MRGPQGQAMEACDGRTGVRIGLRVVVGIRHCLLEAPCLNAYKSGVVQPNGLASAVNW